MGLLKAALLALVVLLVSCGSGDGPSESSENNEDIGHVGEGLSSSTTSTIAAGTYHMCALFQGGKVVCVGGNTFGQLGNGSTFFSPTPVVVPGITTAISVSASESHTCAVLSDHTIRCWGRNHVGQLGNGTTTD